MLASVSAKRSTFQLLGDYQRRGSLFLCDEGLRTYFDLPYAVTRIHVSLHRRGSKNRVSVQTIRAAGDDGFLSDFVLVDGRKSEEVYDAFLEFLQRHLEPGQIGYLQIDYDE